MVHSKILESRMNSCKNSAFLRLNGASIHDQYCQQVADFLQRNNMYERIDLSNNQITPKGLAIIAQQLKGFKHLKEISLDFNLLGGSEVTCEVVHSLLEQNQGIEKFVIRNNEITDEDAVVFGKVISDARGLVYLDLRHNMITSEGAIILLKALRLNQKLCDLLLAGNNIDFKILQEIKTVLASHKEARPTSLQQRKRISPRKFQQAGPPRSVPGPLPQRPSQRVSQRFPGDPLLIEQERTANLRDRYQFEADQMHDQQIQEEKIIHELERDAQQFATDNELLREDNRRIHAEIDELDIRQRSEITELEKRNDTQQQTLIQIEEDQKFKINQSQQDHQKRIVDLNNQWEGRIMTIAEQVDFSRETNNKLEEEIRRLSEDLHVLRKRQEDELRDLETRTREDEYKKYNNNLRRLEDKLTAMEQNREIVNKKYYDMIRELQQSEKELNDELILAENDADKYKQENLDYQHRLAEMNILVDKNSNDLKRRTEQIISMEDELELLTKKLVEQKHEQAGEFSKAEATHQEDKNGWRAVKEMQQGKAYDLERRLRDTQSEYNHLRQDYQKLADLIQNNISKVVYDTFMKNDYF